MPLSRGQLEVVAREAGVSPDRYTAALSRGDLSGTRGQDLLFQEITGRPTTMFSAGEQQAQFNTNREAFNQRLRGEEQEFLGRFRTEFPQILTGIEQELALPQLRQTTQTIGEQLEALPETVTQAAQGKDISANQLARMIASRQQDVLPEFEDVLSAQQFAEEEFGRRAERELVPFQTEIDMMKDRFAREATGFNIDLEGRLNLLLEKMSQQGRLELEELQQANQLAQMEQKAELLKDQLQQVDLGDRVALIDELGNIVSSFNKGRLTGGGIPYLSAPPTGNTENIGTFSQQALDSLWNLTVGGDVSASLVP